MKHLKTYEGIRYNGPKPPFNDVLRNKFIAAKDEPYKSFNIKKLKDEGIKYNIDFMSLLKEILIGRKIAFKCTWCYDDWVMDNVDNLSSPNHSVIGTCQDVIYEDDQDSSSDILVKIDDYDGWHTFSLGYIKNANYIEKVRVYNYTDGPLMFDISANKNSEKYNI